VTVENPPNLREYGAPLLACRLPSVFLRPGQSTAGDFQEPVMIAKERVQAVLDRVRPFLNADGGDIELISVEGNSAAVRLTGMCAGCPSAHMTLHVGIETVLRDEIPEFDTLRMA
jgi:Fe-S cluster biogenesis protein NfuA